MRHGRGSDFADDLNDAERLLLERLQAMVTERAPLHAVAVDRPIRPARGRRWRAPTLVAAATVAVLITATLVRLAVAERVPSHHPVLGVASSRSISSGASASGMPEELPTGPDAAGTLLRQLAGAAERAADTGTPTQIYRRSIEVTASGTRQGCLLDALAVQIWADGDVHMLRPLPGRLLLDWVTAPSAAAAVAGCPGEATDNHSTALSPNATAPARKHTFDLSAPDLSTAWSSVIKTIPSTSIPWPRQPARHG